MLDVSIIIIKNHDNSSNRSNNWAKYLVAYKINDSFPITATIDSFYIVSFWVVIITDLRI